MLSKGGLHAISSVPQLLYLLSLIDSWHALAFGLAIDLSVVTLSLAPFISSYKHPKAIMLRCGLDLVSPKSCSAPCAYICS